MAEMRQFDESMGDDHAPNACHSCAERNLLERFALKIDPYLRRRAASEMTINWDGIRDEDLVLVPKRITIINHINLYW